MKPAFSIITIICVSVLIMIKPCSAQVNITIVPIPPISPFVNQAFTNNGPGIHVTVFSPESYPRLELYGSLERISPSHFSIGLDSSKPGFHLPLTANSPIFLTQPMLEGAFGNFDQGLVLDGITIDDLKDGPNYRLPEGFYNICFFAKQDGQNVSNKICASFYICNISAPQFTQPVNNLIASTSFTIVPPASPIIFSWLPPQSSCGVAPAMINYNFEIKELFEGQSITDALNNPFVFRKVALLTNAFPLDTNLYQHVLQPGKNYIMQVQAVSTDRQSPVIENNGYSAVVPFQYGSNDMVAEEFTLPDISVFYIPFEERKTDFWDDKLTAYLNHSGNDTLVPLKEYIAFALMETGIAYNASAIKLFLSLNPGLIKQKAVKLSYKPNLPDFPEVSNADNQKFSEAHKENLQPDQASIQKFNEHVDELTAIQQKVPASAAAQLSALTQYLNNFKPQLDSFNRVSATLVNEVLSEILFNARNYVQQFTENDNSRLQLLIAAVKELTATAAPDNALNRSRYMRNAALLHKASSNNLFHYASAAVSNEAKQLFVEKYFASSMDQLLPFDVIVWRASKNPPRQPITDAPDLIESYRISYILAALYNHKNPEVASHTSNDLASTIQFSLPANPVYKFWTRNMSNNKLTDAEDVDMKDILTNSKKKWPNPKKPSIVLEVK